MLTTITTKILDNDHKGELGRGTKYQLDIVVKSDSNHQETHEYSLLDLLEGTIDLEAIKRPFKERQRKFDNDRTK